MNSLYSTFREVLPNTAWSPIKRFVASLVILVGFVVAVLQLVKWYGWADVLKVAAFVGVGITLIFTGWLIVSLLKALRSKNAQLGQTHEQLEQTREQLERSQEQFERSQVQSDQLQETVKSAIETLGKASEQISLQNELIANYQGLQETFERSLKRREAKCVEPDQP